MKIARKKSHTNNFISPVFLILVTFTCYFNVFDNTWRYDDGFHLFYAISYSPWEYFFRPEITALHTASNVTPFNPFFYDMTMYFFGLNTVYYYIHMVIILSLASVSSYLLFRLWMDEISSFFASLFFILGGPTVYVTHTLMTGHYAYGMVFFVWSLYFFVKGVRKGNFVYVVVSVVFYILTVTCKEIYIPLVVLIIFIPAGTLRSRIKYSLPYLSVAFLYICWRHLVLGNFIGGYSPENSSMITNIILSSEAYPKIIISLFGDYNFSEYIIYTVLAVVIFAMIKSGIRVFLFSILCLSLAVLPTLPVAHMAAYQGRFYFLFFWGLSIMIVFGFRKVFGNFLFILFMSGFLVLFAHNNYKTQKGIDKHSYEHDLSTKFVVDNYRKNKIGIYTDDDYDFLLLLLRDTYFKYYGVKTDFAVTNDYEDMAVMSRTHIFFTFDPIDNAIKEVDEYLLDTLKNDYELRLFKDVNFENVIYVPGINVEDEIYINNSNYTFSTFYHYKGKKRLYSQKTMSIPETYFNNILGNIKYSFVILDNNDVKYALKTPVKFEKLGENSYLSKSVSIDAGAEILNIKRLNITASNLQCNIEKPSNSENLIQVKKPFQTFFSGWSVLDNSEKQQMSLFLYLNSYQDNETSYLLKAFRTKRPDIVNYFKNNNYIYSGFSTASGFSDIPTGMYKISVVQKYKNEYYECPNKFDLKIEE